MFKMTTPAFYARVSSEKQAQENTIASQVEALKSRIMADDLRLLDEHQFIDNGYSGSNIVRPALEKLRDQIAAGVIDKIYIHSPDRLSRKYAYQMILIEEFEKYGVEVIFLNFQKSNENPESQLLLQMQGMIAEYERSKILERHRRGKIHAAKRGSISVLSVAPYGYRYIDKHTGEGEASFEIIDEEAQIVKKIFNWIAQDRLTLGAVIRLLSEEKIPTRKGKMLWDRSTIWYLLKNPAYKGEAAFGRRKTGVRLPHIRPRRDSNEHPKNNSSRYAMDEENWISIPVPAIIDTNLFNSVQEQMEENKKRARAYQPGDIYLLQGLLVCQYCSRAYCGGRSIKRYTKKETIHLYYRCTGTDSARFGGTKICNNRQVGANAIERVVWEEVKKLLKNPQRIFEEYQRRLMELEKSPVNDLYTSLEKRREKLERGISLLIDSYAQQYITKAEFEPRIQAMRKNLLLIQEQQDKLVEQRNLTKEMELIVWNLDQFSGKIIENLEQLDWHGKRDIIRRIVKRIELGHEDINIVYKIGNLPRNNNDISTSAQHCCNRTGGSPAYGSPVGSFFIETGSLLIAHELLSL
jgi:site-specific DNA recombinase